jgi:hypothetical protein
LSPVGGINNGLSTDAIMAVMARFRGGTSLESGEGELHQAITETANRRVGFLGEGQRVRALSGASDRD